MYVTNLLALLLNIKSFSKNYNTFLGFCCG